MLLGAGLSLAQGLTGFWARKKWDERKTEMEREEARKAEEKRKQADKDQQELSAATGEDKKSLEEEQKKKKKDERAHEACRERLERNWVKIKQPEYAIAQGLITRDEYKAVREEYYTQSLISIGLVLPFLFTTFAVLVTPRIGVRPGWKVCLFLILVQAALVWVGADRRHKFDMGVESLIRTRFMRNCETAKKPADTAAEKSSMTALIRKELASLKIVQDPNATGLKIDLGEDPSKKTSS